MIEDYTLMHTEFKKDFKFTPGVIGYPLLFVILIWLVFWVEIRFGINLNSFGLRPLEFKGLRGILFSPFIHSGIEHLWNNTLPLLFLSMGLFFFYRRVSFKVLLFTLVVGGMITWSIGRPSNHIGASGMIYALASFLFFKGIISKHYRLLALSMIVIFLYGGLVWFTMPIKDGISWEGHLGGAMAGIIAAFIFRKRIAVAPKFEWEKPDYRAENDDFMQQFDDDGNFSPLPPPIEEEE